MARVTRPMAAPVSFDRGSISTAGIPQPFAGILEEYGIPESDYTIGGGQGGLLDWEPPSFESPDVLWGTDYISTAKHKDVVTTETETCPEGTTGTPPNCVKESECPTGWIKNAQGNCIVDAGDGGCVWGQVKDSSGNCVNAHTCPDGGQPPCENEDPPDCASRGLIPDGMGGCKVDDDCPPGQRRTAGNPHADCEDIPTFGECGVGMKRDAAGNCVRTAECPDGWTLLGGVCHPPKVNAECPDGFSMLGGNCMPDTGLLSTMDIPPGPGSFISTGGPSQSDLDRIAARDQALEDERRQQEQEYIAAAFEPITAAAPVLPYRNFGESNNLLDIQSAHDIQMERHQELMDALLRDSMYNQGGLLGSDPPSHLLYDI